MSRSTDDIVALMKGEGSGPVPTLARGGLWALSLLYATGITVYWQLFRLGLLKRTRLRPMVISVGNLTVGGTGKTTAVQHVVRALRDGGFSVAVLSYGYQAASRDTVRVVSDRDGPVAGPEEAGDEAYLLATTLPGTPVLIGRRRTLSGAEADQSFAPDVLVCDDAFQYWRLARDIDMLLVDAVEPWGYGHVLPRGLLREPKGQARRADAALITHADLAGVAAVAALRRELERMGLRVWQSRHAPRNVTALDGTDVEQPAYLQGKDVLAVSSLGDPESYEATLRRLGAVVTPRRFPDHHRYTEEEVQAVEAEAAAGGLTPVTTAKDAVKLTQWARPGAWRVLNIALDIDDSATFDEWLLKSAREHRSRRSR